MNELEKAKENYESLEYNELVGTARIHKLGEVKAHKGACERWSEWILEKHKQDNIYEYQDKLQDLQETIEFYESQGIE